MKRFQPKLSFTGMPEMSETPFGAYMLVSDHVKVRDRIAGLRNSQDQGQDMHGLVSQDGYNSAIDDARALFDKVDFAPAAEPIPKPGDCWTHYNGTPYQVLHVANLPDNPRYPQMVVYQGPNGQVWSRPLSDWHRSMTFTCPASAAPEVASSNTALVEAATHDDDDDDDDARIPDHCAWAMRGYWRNAYEALLASRPAEVLK